MSISPKGIIPGIAIAALLAAWLPVNTGNTVQTQLEQAITINNQQENTFRVEILEYDKSLWSSELITRLTLNTPAESDNEASYIDIRHFIDHGFISAAFKSEVIITEEIRDTLKLTDDHRPPLRFDGEISSSAALINTYLDRVSFLPDSGDGSIVINPAMIRLNYDIEHNDYQLDGSWNGAQLAAGQDNLNIKPLSLTVEGKQETDLLWKYQSQLRAEGFAFGNQNFSLNSESIRVSDQFDIHRDNQGKDSIFYDSTLEFSHINASQNQLSLLDMSPATLSYNLSGPDIMATESLIAASQRINSETMTQQDIDTLMPLFSEFIRLLKLDIYQINLVTQEGSIRGNLNMSLDASQQDVMHAVSFPPLLLNILVLDSDLTISKSLLGSMLPLQILATQLDQKDAYLETEDDMIVKTKMRDGQLTLNDVPF
ncbi:DUF945 family protein [Oceanospirillum sediminis]|uniref:DUF945 family protein n=1 Tax=Oceanospirillum sediminis TaxID=2760088 RepID=A0A839ITG1_9GAMM|nr:DUF945 family protein [Oceanospirillum sediminis]MBB1487769.1 DUF945 family protein [Oceanospirillum sediminis]